MKKHRGKPVFHITPDRIQQYTEKMSSEESEALKAITESSSRELEYTDMLSGKLISSLLQMMIRLSGAQSVLEIGTFTGYSAVAMAEALPRSGQVVTIELNERYQDIARKHFELLASDKNIRLLKGDALELLKKVEGPFDLIFLDADKIHYPDYLQLSLPLLKKGGILAADNVLWDGTVVQPGDEKSKAIHRFNELVRDHHELVQIMLPVRDGITIARKK